MIVFPDNPLIPLALAGGIILIGLAVFGYQVRILRRHLPPGQSEGPPGDRRRRR